jgi:hypothetical protein
LHVEAQHERDIAVAGLVGRRRKAPRDRLQRLGVAQEYPQTLLVLAGAYSTRARRSPALRRIHLHNKTYVRHHLTLTDK